MISVASSPASRSSASCSAFSCSGVMARQREIRLPANAKAGDVCANAAFRISALHRCCLQDVITSILACILAVTLTRHTAFRHLQSRPHCRRSLTARARFKTLIYLKDFGVGGLWGVGFNEQTPIPLCLTCPLPPTRLEPFSVWRTNVSRR
jgi:hypothetical protein